MIRKRYAGNIHYNNAAKGLRGREWFDLTIHGDGSQTLHAHGELFDRLLTRDVVYSLDENFYPLDCYVRLQRNGQFLGAGWMQFDDNAARCVNRNIHQGEVSQTLKLDRHTPSFGPHPICCDVLHLARFDHANPERIQTIPGVLLSSLEHDGGSGPFLSRIDLRIKYYGRERVVVAAGEFDADHYEFLLEGTLPEQHPTEHLWCLPESFILVKVEVGGYIGTTYELMEYKAEDFDAVPKLQGVKAT